MVQDDGYKIRWLTNGKIVESSGSKKLKCKLGEQEQLLAKSDTLRMYITVDGRNCHLSVYKEKPKDPQHDRVKLYDTLFMADSELDFLQPTDCLIVSEQAVENIYENSSKTLLMLREAEKLLDEDDPKYRDFTFDSMPDKRDIGQGFSIAKDKNGWGVELIKDDVLLFTCYENMFRKMSDVIRDSVKQKIADHELLQDVSAKYLKQVGITPGPERGLSKYPYLRDIGTVPVHGTNDHIVLGLYGEKDPWYVHMVRDDDHDHVKGTITDSSNIIHYHFELDPKGFGSNDFIRNSVDKMQKVISKYDSGLMNAEMYFDDYEDEHPGSISNPIAITTTTVMGGGHIVRSHRNGQALYGELTVKEEFLEKYMTPGTSFCDRFATGVVGPDEYDKGLNLSDMLHANIRHRHNICSDMAQGLKRASDGFGPPMQGKDRLSPDAQKICLDTSDPEEERLDKIREEEMLDEWDGPK